MQFYHISDFWRWPQMPILMQKYDTVKYFYAAMAYYDVTML